MERKSKSSFSTGFDPDDRTISISDYLANLSCKKQSNLGTQDVITTTSPSITKALVVYFISIYPFLWLKCVFLIIFL